MAALRLRARGGRKIFGVSFAGNKATSAWRAMIARPSRIECKRLFWKRDNFHGKTFHRPRGARRNDQDRDFQENMRGEEILRRRYVALP